MRRTRIIMNDDNQGKLAYWKANVRLNYDSAGHLGLRLLRIGDYFLPGL